LLSTSSFEKQEQEKGGKDVESGPSPPIPGDKINVTDLQELLQSSEWDVD